MPALKKTDSFAELIDQIAPAQVPDSLALPGAPTATTPATADNSGQIATTAFVKAQGYVNAAGAAAAAPVQSVQGKTGAVDLTFGPSGAGHAPGLLPDPGATAGTSRFACENGLWAVPAAAVALGGAISGGATAGQVLVVGAGGVLAQTDNLTLTGNTAAVGFSVSTTNQVRVGLVSSSFAGLVLERNGQWPVGLYNWNGTFAIEINGDFRLLVNPDGTNGHKNALYWYHGSSTGSNRETGRVTSDFVDNTDAAFTSYTDVIATDHAGQRRGLRVQADGTQALLGFFGATPTAKPAVSGSRGGNAALASLLSALAALGLLTDSTTA